MSRRTLLILGIVVQILALVLSLILDSYGDGFGAVKGFIIHLAVILLIARHQGLKIKIGSHVLISVVWVLSMGLMFYIYLYLSAPNVLAGLFPHDFDGFRDICGLLLLGTIVYFLLLSIGVMKISKKEIFLFLGIVALAYVSMLKPGYLCIKGPTTIYKEPVSMLGTWLSGYQNVKLGILEKGERFEYLEVDTGKMTNMYQVWYKGWFGYIDQGGDFAFKADTHLFWRNERHCE